MSYMASRESEGVQRYGPNTKTENRVVGYKTDLVTFYMSICRCDVKRESCWTPGEDHNDIWCIVRGRMVVEIQCREHGSPA